MFVTQCPQCQSQFRVTEGQLNLANGRVRCGHCLKVFEAQATEPATPDATVVPPTQASPSTQTPLSLEPVVLDRYYYQSPSPLKAAISFLILVISCLGLSGQYLWFQRAELANESTLRPIYRLFCEQVSCDLNSKEGLALLSVKNAVIREHPDFLNAIEVSVFVENRGAFYQPYPAVELSLNDIQGQFIVRRTFDPKHYLENHQPQDLLPPKRSIEIHLTLSAPNKSITSYEVQLAEAL